jgi:hypothetical protein
MRNLCVNLNFNIDVFKTEFDLFSLPKIRFQLLGIDTINPKLIDLLLNNNIEIRAIEVFYSEPNFGGGIHSDGIGDEGNDVTKLNYIFGGKNSLMHWYKLKPNARKIILDTEKDTPYINYYNEDTVRIHSAKVGFPSIVQVAVPHNVRNFSEPRYCVCLVIHDAITKKRLPFDYLADLLKEFKA